MSVLPSFAERKRVWVFRRCTLSQTDSACILLLLVQHWVNVYEKINGRNQLPLLYLQLA